MFSKKNTFFLSLCSAVAAQAQPSTEECFSSSSIVWAVILTIMLLLAISVGVYTLWRYYWRSRKGEHLVLVTADPEKGETFAFDNEAFKEGTPITRTLNGDKLGGIKWPEFINLQQNGNAKMRSMDDSCIAQEPAKNIVPLRSHDFTGLGFNIYGNMRDGIYVKDVSHRGPANESGRIQPGDRITSVRISFRHMVYEDALTILSYASPYEVQIEVENRGGKTTSVPSTLLRSKQNPSTPSERIIHPFFRSQSISDLTQISSKSSSKRTSMNSHQMSTIDTGESKPAVLEISPVTVKKIDKGHKFGVRVLPDMKSEELKTFNHIQPFNLTVENEKNQNTSNIVFDHNKMQQKAHTKADFDEIDLSDKTQALDEVEYKSNRTKTPSPPTNVKSIIVKGIQNLKDKLHQPNHKKQNSLEIPQPVEASSSESFVIDMKPSRSLETGSIVKDVSNEVKKIENNVQAMQRTFLENEKSFVIDMKPPTPINGVSKTDSFSSNEGEGSKRSKRKAPAPPVTTDVELHAEPSDIVSIKDSESEIVGSTSTTIELNSTHITVHHIPDDSERKAASLGDLSRIVDEDTTSVLERALSLELADGTISNPRDSKKRKAPNPPPDELSFEEVSNVKEPRLEILGQASLKKASLFGTLEEAIQQTEEDSDSLVSPNSGKSSPEMYEITNNHFVSSTPMKISNIEVLCEHTIQNGDIQIEQEKPRPAQRTSTQHGENSAKSNHHTSIEDSSPSDDSREETVGNSFTKDIIGDFSKEMNGEFAKGISGDWNISSTDQKIKTENKDWDVSESVLNDAYVTALNISVEDKPPDLPTSPPPNMNSYVTEIKVMTRLDGTPDDDEDEILDISDKDMTLLEQECDDSKIFKNGVYFGTDESLLLNGNMTSSFSNSTAPSVSAETSRRPSKIESFINTINEKSQADVNLSDEQILALKTSTNKINSHFYKTNGENLTKLNGDSPSSNKRRIPSKSPSPSGKSPQRGNISITSIKSSGSRIPVRAFGNGNNTNGSFNGNTSSSSDSSVASIRSMIPDPKTRKSRKPDETEHTNKFPYSSTFSVSPISKSNMSSPEQRRFNGNSETSITQIVVDAQK